MLTQQLSLFQMRLQVYLLGETNMQCNSCGAAIPDGANHCPSCGAPVFTPGSREETFLSTPGSFREMASSPAGLQPEQTFPANPAGFSSTPASVPYGQAGYPSPPVQQAPLYLGAQPPSLPYVMPPPVLPRRPQRRAGLSRGMTILLVILALLIMSSGFALIYYSTVYHPNQLRMQATATSQTSQTMVARVTATANAQATGTAVAIANATATAQAQATADVIATATALQNIYTSATRGTPALSESLGFNTGSNWDEDLAQGGGGCSFSGGTYHASLYSKGFYFTCIANNTNFSNFALQVQMKITRGDAGGLVLRGNNSAAKFYVLRVGRDGTYDLFTSKDTTHSTPLAYGNSPTIIKDVGRTNLLTIVARGSSIYIYINKQYVGSVADGTYKSGQIGVLAEDHTNPTDVIYSNLQVWRL